MAIFLNYLGLAVSMVGLQKASSGTTCRELEILLTAFGKPWCVGECLGESWGLEIHNPEGTKTRC